MTDIHTFNMTAGPMVLLRDDAADSEPGPNLNTSQQMGALEVAIELGLEVFTLD
jgi:hypothetical protein